MFSNDRLILCFCDYWQSPGHGIAQFLQAVNYQLWVQCSLRASVSLGIDQCSFFSRFCKWFQKFLWGQGQDCCPSSRSLWSSTWLGMPFCVWGQCSTYHLLESACARECPSVRLALPDSACFSWQCFIATNKVHHGLYSQRKPSPNHHTVGDASSFDGALALVPGDPLHPPHLAPGGPDALEGGLIQIHNPLVLSGEVLLCFYSKGNHFMFQYCFGAKKNVSLQLSHF
jgi:hypothetical protein